MLTILLSFAQFERKIISEQTRDKIAAARARGSGPVGGRSSASTSIPSRAAPPGAPRNSQSRAARTDDTKSRGGSH